MIFPWLTTLIPAAIAIYILIYTPEKYLAETVPLLLSGFVLHWLWRRIRKL
jgi:hypothetical protein